MKFSTGIEASKANTSGFNFAAISLMSDDEKERICRSLLAEFGVTKINATSSGELLHSCCLPFGQHKNGDANPSAGLNYRKLTYSCFGCGNSGGLLWFVATCRGTDANEAREWLTSETGVGGEQSLGKLLEYFDAVWSPKRPEFLPLPNLSTKLLDPWRAIHPYMTDNPPNGRGVDVDTLIHFSVGYAPEMPVRLGMDKILLSERIVIPNFWKGKLVGWQSRRLWNDGSPKYVNSPDFPKDRTIYNYEARRPSVVVESPMSVLVRFRDNQNIEAVFGASVTERQIKLLADHPKVVLFLDNDNAGWNATKKIGDELMAYTNVYVVENPYDADPADLNSEVYNNLVDNSSVPYALWNPPKELVKWLG